MQQQPITMSHALGTGAKWMAIIVVWILSVTLSLSFFTAIAPPDKPWFPLAGMGLTEGGFALWMIVFMLTRHEPIPKAIALVMTIASAICSLSVAGFEFYGLLAAHFDLTQNAQIAQIVSISLVVIFIGHFSAFIVDMFAAYFSRPGHSFSTPGGNLIPARNGNLIPQMSGNLIPTQQQYAPVTVKELKKQHAWITAQLASVGAITEEGSDPLAQRQLPRPRGQAVALTDERDVLTFGDITGGVGRAASSLVKRLRGNTRNGNAAGLVPGEVSATTSASTSPTENAPDLAALTDLDLWAAIYERQPDHNGLTFPEWVKGIQDAGKPEAAPDEEEEEEEEEE